MEPKGGSVYSVILILESNAISKEADRRQMGTLSSDGNVLSAINNFNLCQNRLI